MIVEERIYTLMAGKVPDYLRAYESEGLAIQKEILGTMVGYFSTEFGPLNQIVHLWAYRDLADRETRRRRLNADPGWQTYVVKVRQWVVNQENKLLIPAAFSPNPVEGSAA